MAHKGKSLGIERKTDLEIVIKKGHVRRAIQAADTVYSAAKTDPAGDVEPGFVLMTAVLLVERLATASGRDPVVVLNKMAECFAVKREYVRFVKRGLPS